MASKSPALSLKIGNLGLVIQRPQRPGLRPVPKELVGIQLLITIPPQIHNDHITKIKLHDIVK